jgi:multicomponent Na+:H+ antiporter subunit C
MLKALIILLFSTGLWGILSGRSLIRKIIGLSLLNSSVIVLFILGGIAGGTTAPILTAANQGLIVDPLPQALMLTAIVVGLSVTAVALILTVRLYRSLGTIDIEEIEKRLEDN